MIVFRRALPVAAVVALAACSSTVTGQGTAASRPATPTPPASATSAPPSSAPVSSTPVTPPTHAPTGRATSVPYTDTAGRFKVVLPGTPETADEPGSFGGYSFHVHLAAVHSPYIAIVEGEQITPALKSGDYEQVLSSAVTSFASATGAGNVTNTATTFRGHQARTAVFTHAGTSYELLIFVYSGSQVYLMFAPQGAKFAALANSFQAL